MNVIIRKTSHYLDLVKFPHTVFSVPFALISLVVAADGFPNLRILLFIAICLTAARTAAMTFNRIVDRHIDARNPRTASRHLPQGVVSLSEAYSLWIGAVLLFLLGAWMLNPLCFYLSPVALFVLCGYSFTKRFTSYCHLVLGLALGMAPVGAWIGVKGVLELPPIILGLGVMAWVAGFDIIYALPDESFDRSEGLHSLVVKWGRKRALWISRGLHVVSCVSLLGFGLLAGLGSIYLFGVMLFAGSLRYEHHLVTPEDISRVNVAFFTVNGTISLLFALVALLDIFI